MLTEKLIKEIKELGGTDSDFELLADFDDGQEEIEVDDTTASKNLSLEKELASIIKSSGLNLAQINDESEESEHSDKETDLNIKQRFQDQELDESNQQKLSEIVGKVKLNLKKKLCFEMGTEWFSVSLNELQVASIKANDKLSKTLYEKAEKLYKEEAERYAHDLKNSSGNRDFISTVLKSGTVTDKVSALTLLIQESPLHTLDTLEKSLLNGMAKKKSRREALMALDSIKDLMTSNLLPDRKLKYFADQPLSATNLSNKHLILWYFEDKLKKIYFEFISVLEEMGKDVIANIKQKAVYYIYDCFVAKPEQEHNLLKLLINKLGDKDRKTVSKVSHLVLKSLNSHPNMKVVIAKEIEQLLFKPQISKKTQYYCITVLNQFVLAKTDKLVANHLINIYFILFEILVKENKTSQVDAKMMGAILTGVNRAFPFSDIEPAKMDSKIDMLYKISHLGSFTTSVQALSLIFQVEFSRQSVSDRYYRALYESLFDSRLIHNSKHSMFLNLLYRSIKNDVSIERVKAFVKRLVQVCSRLSTPFICASLFMISELCKSMPSIYGMIVQPEENADLATFYDGRKREPLFANAGFCCFWELTSFIKHFHPTVALYASTLLNGEAIQVPENSVNYDPLQNHTLQRFLDRFVYKNPKKVENSYKGASLMQPRGKKGMSEDMIVAGGKKRNVIVHDENGRVEQMDDDVIQARDYCGKSIDQIPVDEQFYLHYFNSNPSKVVNSAVDSEDDVWDAIQGSNMPQELQIDESDDELGPIEYSDDQQDYSDDEIIESDGEMEQLMGEEEDDQDEFGDEESISDAFDELQEDEKPRKRKTVDRMAEKAKKLGYSGDFFQNPGSAFASAQDFEQLIDLQEKPSKKQRV